MARKVIARQVSFILICTLFLTLIVQPAGWSGYVAEAAEAVPLQQNNGELLQNPDFEDVVAGKPVGWTVLNSQTITEMAYAPASVYNGTYSVKLTDENDQLGAGLRSAFVPVTPGSVYRASAYTYNASGTSQLYLEFWNSANARIGVKVLSNTTSGQWKALETEEEAPVDAAYATVLLYQHAANTGVAYADQASLMLVPLQTGLLQNPDFEDVAGGKPVGWTALNSQSVIEMATAPEPVYSGTYSVKMTDTSDQLGVGLRSAFVPATPGNTYRATAYTYNASGTSQLYLEYWNSANTRIGVKVGSNTANGEWKAIQIEEEAPAEAAYATILFYQYATNVGVAYVDQASLVLIEPDPELLQNPDFEDVTVGKPVGWTALNAATVAEMASAPAPVYNGAYSVKLTDASDQTGGGLRSAFVPLTPGEMYRASVYAYNESGASQLYLEYWNSAKTRIAVKIQSSAAIGEWKALEMIDEPPAEAAYATLLLYQTGANVGVTYFDQASFRLVPPEPVREFPLLVNSHPRLYLTAADIPAVQARASDAVHKPFGLSGKEIWDAVEQAARTYLQETSLTISSYYGGHSVTYVLPPEMPDPMPNPPGYTAGRYPYWTMLARAIQTRLETLSWAYVITGEQAFADRAKAYALSVAEWEQWTDPSYACNGLRTCLDTSHLTIGVSTAYDLLYNVLQPQERAALEQAIESKGLEPLYKDLTTFGNDNGYAIRAAALGIGASVLHGTSPESNKYLTRATNYLKWFFDLVMESGEQEGHMYTSISTDNLLRAVDHIARTTGTDDVSGHPFLNDFVVRWANNSLAPGGGGLANYSDSGLSNYYSMTMRIINTILNNGEAGWYLQETKAGEKTLDGFIYFDPTPAISEPDGLPSEVLDEIGWASLRSGWEQDDTLLTFVSSDSWIYHSHFDQNSFQIATNKSWIASDPGYQEYVAGPAHEYTLKLGHSTIQVDGQGQSVKGGGELTKGMLAPTYDYVKGSAPGAYVNPKLTKYDRHIVYLKPDYFVMFDDLQADQPRSFDWIMHSGALSNFTIDGQQAADGQTVNGNKLHIRKDNAELAATFLHTGTLPITVGKYPGAENYGYYTKVGDGTQSLGKQFVTVIKARPYEETGLTQAEELLPPYATSGQEFKILQTSGTGFVFYRGQAAGDSITFEVNVPENDTYALSTLFLQSPLYGQVQAYVDGQPVGGVYDGYHTAVQTGVEFGHGNVSLTAGQHTIRYEVVGKNASAGGYLMGIDAIRLVSQNTPQEPALELNASLMQGTGATGARVERFDDPDVTDLVVFKTGSASYTIEDVSSDADQAVVSLGANNSSAGYKMTRGTSLAYGGKTLLQSTALFNAAFDRDSSSSELRGVIELEQAQSVSIYTNTPTAVTLNGQTLGSGTYSYNAQTGLLTVEAGAGMNEIVVSEIP